MLRSIGRAVLTALALAGCSGGGGVSDDAATDAPPTASDGGRTLTRDPADCDPLDETECALPWPSNLYLSPDPTRRTGFTLRFGATTLPENVDRRLVEPDAYRRLDGYG